MQLWIYLVVIITIIHATCSLEVFSTTACYVTLEDNMLQARCDPGQVIAITSLQAMAKRKTDGCPDMVTSLNDTTPGDNCCVFNSTDCGARYFGPDYTDFYEACHGQISCSHPVRQLDTATGTNCSTENFTENTTYMILYYNCIPVTNILSPCEDLNVTSTAVYLWNSGYPNETILGSDNCACSVEASCSTNIQIIARDTRFQDENGVCKQKLVVEEESKLFELNCTQNNAYSVRTIHTSSYVFFTLRLYNDLSTNGGNFWIHISGADTHAEMTLSCGTKAKSEISTRSGKVFCGSNVTDPSTIETTTTEEITTTAETTTQDDGPPVNAPTVPDADTGQDTSILLAVLLLVVLLVCLAIIAGIVYWKREAIKRQLCVEKGKVEDSRSLSASEDTESERSSSPVYDTMPAGDILLPTTTDMSTATELPPLPGDGITKRMQQLEPLFPGKNLPPIDNRKPLSSIGTMQELPDIEEGQIFPMPFKILNGSPVGELEQYEMSRIRPLPVINQHHLSPIDTIGSYRMRPRLALLSMIMNEQNNSLQSLSPVESAYSEVYTGEHVTNRRRRQEVTTLEYEPYQVPNRSMERSKIRKKKKRLMQKMNEPYETGYPQVHDNGGHMVDSPTDY